MFVTFTRACYGKLIVRIGFALVFATLGVVSASAQGCALCYTQAAGSGMRMIHALWAGIGILVFPPMLLSVFFTVLSYRKRNRFRGIDYDIDVSTRANPTLSTNPSRHMGVQSGRAVRATYS